MPQHSISTFVTSTLPLTDVTAQACLSHASLVQIKFQLIGVEYKILNPTAAGNLAKRLRKIADSIDLLADRVNSGKMFVWGNSLVAGATDGHLCELISGGHLVDDEDEGRINCLEESRK